MLPVQDLDRVAVADAAVGERHEQRVAVVEDVDVGAGAQAQPGQHDEADDGHEHGIDQRARPEEAIIRGLARGQELLIAGAVPGNQEGWAVDLGHDVVAGVDAQPAADAAELQAIADVDPGRADDDALLAVDAVAPPRPAGTLLVRPARLPAPGAVGHGEAVLVEQAALDARPGAHRGADLLARPAGQEVGGRGEQADEAVDDGTGRAGEEAPHDRRRVVEIHHPGTAGRERDQQPRGVLEGLADGLAGGRAAAGRGACAPPGRPRSAAPPRGTGRSRRSAGRRSRTRRGRTGRSPGTGRRPREPARRSGNRSPAARSRARRSRAAARPCRPGSPDPALPARGPSESTAAGSRCRGAGRGPPT